MGHQGIERTITLLRPRVYWPHLHDDVRQYVANCSTCVISKRPVPIKTTSTPVLASFPLQILAIDFTKPEPATDGWENVHILTDVFTKFTQAIPTRNQEAQTVAKVLVSDWFQKYGVPERIHSDQSRDIESKLVTELYTASAGLTLPPTILKEMASVNDSTEPSMTSFASSQRTRSDSGINTSQKSSKPTTTHHMHPQGFLHTSCSLGRSHNYPWMTCFDDRSQQQWEPSTGSCNIGCVSSMPTDGHTSS